MNLGLGLLTDSSPWASLLGEFPGAAMAADFTRGLYYAEGGKSLEQFVTDARASDHVVTNADGTLTTVGSGVVARGTRGLDVYGAATNKCTNYNANPTDLTGVTKAGDAASVLTVVDDAVALAAAGLSGVCTSGQVYKLDNSLGVASARIAVSGSIGATGDAVFTAQVRGSGTYTFHSGYAAGASVTLTSEYQRAVWLDTAGTGGSSRLFYGGFVDAGGVLYFILNRMTQTSVDDGIEIVVAGSSATRAASLVQAVQGAGSIPFPAYSGTEHTFTRTVNANGVTGDRVVKTLRKDANNQYRLHFVSGVLRWEAFVGGVSQGAATASGIDDGGTHTMVCYINETTKELAMRVDGAAQSTVTATSVPTDIILDQPGHNGGANHLNGVIEREAYGAGDYLDAWAT